MNIFIHENPIGNVACQNSAILSRPQWVYKNVHSVLIFERKLVYQDIDDKRFPGFIPAGIDKWCEVMPYHNIYVFGLSLKCEDLFRFSKVNVEAHLMIPVMELHCDLYFKLYVQASYLFHKFTYSHSPYGEGLSCYELGDVLC